MKSLLCGALLAGAGCAIAPLAVAAQDSGSLTLEQALALAGASNEPGTETQNPRAMGPRADVEAAEALIRQARLRPNPELSIEVENFAGTGDYSGLQSSEYTLSAGLPLELGGKRNARTGAAKADLAVAQLREQLAVADIGLMVRQRYVSAVAAQARVALAQDVYDRSRELARIANVLVEAGREPPLRALRAQSELAEAEAELKAAQATALAARFALGALWSDQSAPTPTNAFPKLRPPYELLSSYEGLDLKLASAERQAAEAGVARERSLGAPDLAVSAGVRRFHASNDQALVVGVAVPLPLWNQNQGNISAAQARVRSASAREAVAAADYSQTVSEARAEYLAAEAKADTLEAESLPQAEEALRLAEIGYREGKLELIELLAAGDARDGVRRALIDAREAQGRSAALLIRLAAADRSAR
ncbi:MAG: TolC family protein [Porphyrobacter sp.]|nr:TolC family protein [Porphyrobacter sp.]